ncbi:flagellar basal body rod protein FlgF [Larsenimonas rhizosphaerae]|uniref:flagellar basal body rod protein FlgF n=1 Tax=Larsenimonas rhizosphaerae TaxID=2944682 RepID=UPI002033B258|nr:flagellar basal body rod protein FlgF [Larsenimonas rhizosphaerae]MCM2130399.1 flagellar basal body rod protein FlgF [Larsenimonas rhizosphaerae]
MDRMIYTALSGAQQTLERQAVVANNLSNVSTTGFKSQLSAFRAVPIQGDGLATRSVVADTTPGADYSEGMIEETGRSLDVAIDGDGWLAVDDGNGREVYTRDGRLRVDATGLLMSGGKPVMGEGGPVVLPLNASFSVASDGTISALGLGDQPNTLAEVGRLKLVNPGNEMMKRGDDGLFRMQADANGNPAPPRLPGDDGVSLVSGALESSNVNATEAMVAMIDNARRFEMNMRMVDTADENEQRANQLLSLT